MIVYPRLVGRLGNQQFEAACAIGYARAHGIDFHIPEHTANDSLWHPHITWLVNPKFDASKPIKKIEERHHHFNHLDFSKNWGDVNLELNGYWQSERYFEHCKQEIADLLGFSHPTFQAIAMHVRRGDYLTLPDQFPVLPVKYYEQAMRDLPNIPIWIFSDDIEWCRQNLSHLGNVKFMDEQDPLKAMRLMCECNYQVIANSSFSLFPALLYDKVVVSPHPDIWYGKKAGLPTKDLIPERFIKIRI
jgi:hypothetical protein